MADHIHCCDCDDCLNGAGGFTLPGAGKVTRTGGRRPGKLSRPELAERERVLAFSPELSEVRDAS